jgi:hypothetical protein
MKDVYGLLVLAVLIVAGLGFSNLMGSLLEQRAVLQAEASP